LTNLLQSSDANQSAKIVQIFFNIFSELFSVNFHFFKSFSSYFSVIFEKKTLIIETLLKESQIIIGMIGKSHYKKSSNQSSSD
jgi:hypothetical protein